MSQTTREAVEQMMMTPDMEAVLAVEAIVGRPDDDHGRVLNPILDAAYWRKHV